MKNVQSQSTSNPNSIAQVAAEAALGGDNSCIQPMVKAFRERHDHVVARLNAMRGVRCLPAQGAFYAFPDCREAMAAKGFANDVAMVEHILNEVGVALVPGSAFGAEGYVRISYATSLKNLNGALDRLERVFGRR